MTVTDEQHMTVTGEQQMTVTDEQQQMTVTGEQQMTVAGDNRCQSVVFVKCRQTCSTKHYMYVSGKNSAMVQLIHNDHLSKISTNVY